MPPSQPTIAPVPVCASLPPRADDTGLALAARAAADCAALGTCVVTGAAGFVGRRVCVFLLRHGATRVVGTDVRPLDAAARERMAPDDARVFDRVEFRAADLRDAAQVDAVVAEAASGGTVFHLASFGMSGREQIMHAMIRAVNVGGAQNVLDACRRQGVARLVYTSTYNTVFCGRKIDAGTEALPRAPLAAHADTYSRTKSQAEALVLDAGAVDAQRFATAALRPAGIYADGEERHIPRIVGMLHAGLFSFTVGAKASLVDFVYADNLVLAEVLAALALARNPTAVSGQAFFINDESPINNFEFFRPLIEGLGFSFPRIRLPVAPMFLAAWLMETGCRVLSPCVRLGPMLARAEVYKVGVHHTFSTAHARALLGYRPIVSHRTGMERMVAYNRALGLARPPRRSSALRRVVLALLVALLALWLLPTLVQ